MESAASVEQALRCLVVALRGELLQIVREELGSATETPEGWWTAKEAADHLGLTTKALYALAGREGTFPAHRVGQRSLRFRRAELDLWYQNRKSGRVS
jgi:excisionase family DNA binding protein